MSSRISKRKQPERELKPIKERLKISGKVLDDQVVEILWWMMHAKHLESVDYPISQGKEAVVFRATRLDSAGKPEYVAVKIFKYETSSFHHMKQYIEGDRNFDPRKNPRLMVNDWARKEYSNLLLMTKAGVRVPAPIFCRKNVIIMEFVGVGEYSSALLEEVVLDDPQATFDEILEMMKGIMRAGLVHADLSSFNIIIHHGKPVIIDWAQGLEYKHPNADAFLRKDCNNIADYFAKLGVDCTPESVYEAVIKEKPQK